MAKSRNTITPGRGGSYTRAALRPSVFHNQGAPTAQPSAPQTPAPQAAESAAEDTAKSKEAFKSKFLTLCGIGVLALALVQHGPMLLKGSGKQSPETPAEMPKIVEDEDTDALARKTLWANPSIPFYAQAFCRGGHHAEGCNSEPLHPFVDVYQKLWNKQPEPLRREQGVKGVSIRKSFLDRVRDKIGGR